MKILVLAPQPFYQDRRGAISLKNLLESLVAANHDVTAMVYPQGEHITIPGCRILRVQKLFPLKHVKPGYTWKHVFYDNVMKKMTARLLQQEKFDLLHACEGGMSMARTLSKRFKLPYVYSMAYSLPKELGRKIPDMPLLKTFTTQQEKRAIRNSVGILVPCKNLEGIARTYGSSAAIQLLEDMTMLSAGIPTEKKKHTNLRTPKDTSTLMYVGNLQSHQGMDLLIEGFSLAYLDKEKIRLVVIGGERADISRLKRKAKDLGVSAGIRFLGTKPAKDLGSYFAQADILISPATDRYVTPGMIPSYLDSGRPLLATRHPIHDQILDDSIAHLVDPVDTEVAAGILQLVRDAKLRNDLAASARQRVEEKYSKTAFRKTLNTFYDKIAQEITP